MRDVSHEQWVPFLDGFSQAHRGDRVAVRVSGQAADVPTLAPQPIALAVLHSIHVRVAERSAGEPLERGDGRTTMLRFLPAASRSPAVADRGVFSA